MKKLIREYQELCSLGLPTSEVVPLALDLLQRMMGGIYSGFAWVDENFDIKDFFFLTPVSENAMAVYFEQFHNHKETEVVASFADALKNKIPLVNYARMGKKLFNSSLYADYFSLVGLHHVVRVSVIDGDSRYGMLAGGRSRTDCPYSEYEEQTYCLAARLLAQAFELERIQKLICAETVDTKTEGFLLIDKSGKIMHGCELGLRLFYAATQIRGLPETTRISLPVALVAEACKGGISRGIFLSNNRGQFLFRPVMLNSASETGESIIAVTVKQRCSMAMRLWQETERFNLSGRERQVTVFLGLDYSYDAIARYLGLSRNTIDTYIKRLYVKLKISSREQIVRILFL